MCINICIIILSVYIIKKNHLLWYLSAFSIPICQISINNFALIGFKKNFELIEYYNVALKTEKIFKWVQSN